MRRNFRHIGRITSKSGGFAFGTSDMRNIRLRKLNFNIATFQKPQRSPEEDRELEEKQRQLNEKMQLLEQKTKKVEMLMTRSKGQDFDQPQTEDALPKVIICGVTENNMPKIIVCDGKKKKKITPKLNLPSQQMQTCVSRGGKRYLDE